LLSLGFLSLVYAYFTYKRVWMRWVLLGASIPIAICAIAMRVAVTGWLYEINTNLALGTYHEMEGYIVFVVALIALVIVHRLINYAVRRTRKAQA
jgi:exosortase/archaeosortase family protein